MSLDSIPAHDRVGINKLPVETLRQIILHAAAINPSKYLYEGLYITSLEQPLYMGWLHITHVSRLWREVALTTKSLWTEIILNLGLKYAEESKELAQYFHGRWQACP